MEEVPEYKIGFVHSPNRKISNHFLIRKMVDFTQFYINRLSQTHHNVVTINCETFDEGLDDINDSYDYIVLISSGVFTYNSKDILPEILSHFENNENLSMMGHILDRKESWYEVHPQFIVIRASHWISSGRPKFGDEGETSTDLVHIERSEENFHDDYTPLWIRRSDKRYMSSDNLRFGWSLLSGLLKNGYDVKPFNHSIRSMKGYCYPEYNSDKFYELISNKTSSEEIDYTKKVLLNRLLTGGNQAWVFNTEEINILKSKSVKPFNVVALPCAGFKFLDLLYSNHIDNDTTILLYDFNLQSINWFKYILYSDESDIVSLLKNKPNDILIKGKRAETLFDGDTPTESLIEMINEVYNYYGGKDNFQSLLIQFRQLNYEFVEVDLINDPLKLTYRLSGERNLINISNIFSTDYINLFYEYSEREQIFNRFLRTLTSETVIVGRGIDTYLFEISYKHE